MQPLFKKKKMVCGNKITLFEEQQLLWALFNLFFTRQTLTPSELTTHGASGEDD